MGSLGLTLGDVVVFEGGLGSQILSMLVLLQRRENEPHVRADVSYFQHGLTVPTDDASGLTGWPWELDRYGFNLSDSPPVHRGLRPVPSARDRARVDARFLTSAVQRDWSSVFAIQSTTFDDMGLLGLEPDVDFACIHVRRGDYLRVSARVVGVNESLGVAHRLGSLLPRKVVFLSDEAFPADVQEEIAAEMPNRECLFHSGADQHASHGLMRMASVLITSNSTFSWSAGILSRPGAMVLSPTSFFGVGYELTNSIFQSASDWMLMAPRQN